MNKKAILKYIEEGKEFEFLEKLELMGLETYDEKYKKLISILFVLLNHSSDRSFLPVQQFLFTTIYKVLDSILLSIKTIEEFICLIESSIGRDCEHVPKFIGRFILNVKDGVEDETKSDNIHILEEKLISLNTRFLTNLIEDSKDYEKIISALYNCIDGLEEDRRVILNKNAIDCFYIYLLEKPEDYLRNFIRPLYTGPDKYLIDHYFHVAEPFNGQIFFEHTIENYIDKIKDKSEPALVDDIRAFLSQSKVRSYRNSSVILFSNDNPRPNEDDLKLISENHKAVRPSCLPPVYTESTQN